MRVWGKMTAALEDAEPAAPVGEGAAGTCAAASARLPVRALFETVAIPLASPRTPGLTGLRTVVFDWPELGEGSRQ